MGTFRDDLVRGAGRIMEAVERTTGREIIESEHRQVLESTAQSERALRKMTGWLQDRMASQPLQPGGAGRADRMLSDMLPQVRKASAAQAQRAWIEDPLAGQGVELWVSFVVGRGVPRPRANDSEVQDLLDDTWDDRANQRVLTSYNALREKLVDAALQANVFWVLFTGGDGKVRATLKTFDVVDEVVRHPLDKYRILYYKCTEQPVRYDFVRGCEVPNGEPRTVYYRAHGAFDDSNTAMVEQDEVAGGRDALTPPASMLEEGEVLHLAFNKTSEMAFGIPRMRRLLRWYVAHNEVMESHVTRMKAAASILMQMNVDGSKRDMERAAQAAVGRRSGFDASGGEFGTPMPSNVPGTLTGNAGVKYEPFKIDSGAADMAQSVPQLKAQASGPFPISYYGSEAGSLAGANSVELPVLKFVEADQESVEGILRALGEARIKASIETGHLNEWRAATESELAQIAQATETGEVLSFEIDEQGRVKRDLSFEISLPSPLKRAMGDIITAATALATSIDPNNTNPEVARWLFGICLREGFDESDPAKIVDLVLPRIPEPDPAEEEVPPGAPAGGSPDDPAKVTGADGKKHPPENPQGAKINSPNPEERRVKEAGPIIGSHDEFERLYAAALEHLEQIGDTDADVDGLVSA